MVLCLQTSASFQTNFAVICLYLPHPQSLQQQLDFAPSAASPVPTAQQLLRRNSSNRSNVSAAPSQFGSQGQHVGALTVPPPDLPQLSSRPSSSCQTSSNGRPSSRQAGDRLAGQATPSIPQPSTSQCEGSVTGEGLGAVASLSTVYGSMGGSAAAESVELEELLQAYPLVRAATKGRVREVFYALQWQHMEKMEDWRREAQAVTEGTSSQAQAKAGESWCSASSQATDTGYHVLPVFLLESITFMFHVLNTSHTPSCSFASQQPTGRRRSTPGLCPCGNGTGVRWPPKAPAEKP